MEDISPVRLMPKWQPSFPVNVPTSKNLAVEAVNATQMDIRDFSDGSGIDGGI